MKRSIPMRGARRAAFTLVELMVSLLAGSIVIAAAWRMSVLSTKMFNKETRRADMGSVLRRASAIVRRDFTRAGYFSFRNMAEMATGACGGMVMSPQDQPAVSFGLVNGVQAVYVTGNLTSNDQYRTLPITNPSQVTIPTTSPEFALAFNDETNTFQREELLRAFLPITSMPTVSQGRYISLSAGATVILRELTSLTINGTDVVLDFVPPLPANALTATCFPTNGAVYVAPVATFRYMLENTPVAGMARLVSNDPFILNDADRRLLVRREVDMRTRAAAVPTTIVGTEFVVLDFAQEFRVAAVWDTLAFSLPPVPPVLSYTNNPWALPNPTSVRSLIFDLTVISPDERRPADPSVGRSQADLGARRWSRFEVFLPNMAKRAGFRP